MKKLYRKGTVHPSPPVISDQLSFLPVAILTLAAALSPDDREVLAYLISCSNTTYLSCQKKNTNNNQKNTKSAAAAPPLPQLQPPGALNDHPPLFHCDCFRCYMSYWAKWDSSPNRQLIHEIIDAFEDGLVQTKKGKSSKKERRKKGFVKDGSSDQFKFTDQSSLGKNELSTESDSVSQVDISSSNSDGVEVCVVEGVEKGSMRRLVSFIGEKIWGVLGGNDLEAT